MRGDSLNYLVRLGIYKRGPQLIGMLVGVGIGIAALCFVVALGLGIGNLVRNMMTAGLEENELIVEPGMVTLGPFKVDVAKMTPEHMREIEKIPGVEKVYPQMNIYVPCRVIGTIYGKGIASDIAVTGLPRELIADELPEGEDFAMDPDSEDMPALISPILLEAYNTGFAPINNLPKLAESVIIGRPFTLIVGESSFIEAKSPDLVRDMRARVVGLSVNAPSTGCAIPIEEVRKLNYELIEDFTPYYTRFYVYTDDLRNTEAISDEINRMGFKVKSIHSLLRRTNAIVWVLTAMMSLFGITILAVAAISIANTCALQVIERKTEIGIMRAVGATKNNIRGIFLMEMGLIGLASGLLGLVMSIVTAGIMDGLAHKFLPEHLVLLKPDSFFVWTWWIPVMAICLSVGLSILASWAAARRAANLDPATILTQ